MPTSGEVHYLDHNLTAAGDAKLTRFRREHVGFVFQFYNLIPSLTALENVALVTEIAEHPMGPADALALVGLSDRLNHFPAQLSGGEQQRVAIARAVAKRPEVLLCDEPTGALDYATGKLVLEVLERVNREIGTIVAIITHNAAIAGMADRVVRVSSGAIAEIQSDLTFGPGVVTCMSALHRKLIRDLIHMRGQILAVTLVLACGIATYVTMRSSFRSLEVAQSDYYATFRFADVFTHVKRAPEAISVAISAIPGVATVQTRVIMDVTLDVPGLDEPATGRLISIPERRTPMLNDLFLREGRYIEPGRRDEALISKAFASANNLTVGGAIGAVINGKWERLRIVGIALLPEYIYEIRPSEVFPDNRRFGVLWMSRDALGPAFNMKDAFNDVAISLTRGADEREVISRLDRMLDRYGCLAAYGRSDQISFRFVTDELGELRAYGLILPTLFLCFVAFLLNLRCLAGVTH